MMIWPLCLLVDRQRSSARLRQADLDVARAAQQRRHIERLALDIEGLMGAANGEPLLIEKKDGIDGR